MHAMSDSKSEDCGSDSSLIHRLPMTTPRLVIAGSPANDLWRSLPKVASILTCGADPAEALRLAQPGDALALLAEQVSPGPLSLDAAWWQQAKEKRLRVFIEYPYVLSDPTIAQPIEDGDLRAVVVSDFFGPDLPPLRILGLNGGIHVPVTAARPHLVLARVVGMDTAVFGLTDTATVPLLYEAEAGKLLVATASLSRFVTSRNMPAVAWTSVWQAILRWLLPDTAPLPELGWTESVRASFDRDEPLPPAAERQALRLAADWVMAARLLRHADWPGELLDRSLVFNTVRDKPGADRPCGDGSLGMLEGFSSTIRADGSQPVRYAVRSDCMGEMAMMLSFDAALNHRPGHAAIAANLLDYTLLESDLASMGGSRVEPAHPAHGLIGWALDKPTTFWGDDNARMLMGALAVCALQKETRWMDAILRCLLANFRLTGTCGHRRSCMELPDLEAQGWKHYGGEAHIENTMHMQGWLPACYLWAYARTGFTPLLERSLAAFRTLMAAYPAKWEWVNGSGSLELARALLPLAWLVRVQDTPEHRGWLHRVATDLIELQEDCGAICEVIRVGGGAYKNCIPTGNSAYGTCETTLIARDGDPVADSLYTCNFALIGLHEAAAVTGEMTYAQAEDKLADFLCRIQTRSETQPELSGAWYRAFNFDRWDFWASNSDHDWGPWCMQTGWTQTWITSALALREMKTSLWDLLQQVNPDKDFDRVRDEMLTP
jgi:hypothetical protein